MSVKCQSCNNERKNIRVINSCHVLCNRCNLKLINNSILILHSGRKLAITEKKGDFLIVKELYYNENNKDKVLTDNRKDLRTKMIDIDIQNLMDNRSPLDFGINPSY